MRDDIAVNIFWAKEPGTPNLDARYFPFGRFLLHRGWAHIKCLSDLVQFHQALTYQKIKRHDQALLPKGLERGERCFRSASRAFSPNARPIIFTASSSPSIIISISMQLLIYCETVKSAFSAHFAMRAFSSSVTLNCIISVFIAPPVRQSD